MDEQLYHIRHSLAHLLAIAALEHDPKARLSVGPVTENGFYYDIDFSDGKAPAPEDLKAFEKTMRKLVNKKIDFVRQEISVDEARKRFADNPYKLAIIDDIERAGEAVSLYETGEFTDLCEGRHVNNTSEIDSQAFTLTHLAGAYFRGDESQPMLTRIYGLAFATEAELDAYLAQQEEAKKRDHKKLGRELGLFTLSPLVGSGLPLMQPKGMIIREKITELLWSLHEGKGYDRVWTPHIAKEDLYVTSGHAAKFGDELFRVSGKEEKFIMKPMNCPHHMQLFADNQFSYRDMPVRYFEPATVYRDEKSGQLGGLTRVRSITQDDGHLFCRISQIESEVSTIVSIIKEFYTIFGMMDGYWVSLSVRGDDKSKYLGTDEVWNTAEGALEKAAKENGLNYRRVLGEAAFYGPKLDFMFKDAIGREWQLATIQCDFNLPERFELSFINEKGEKERPVVIHRAISGSLERFMGIIIEHYAGAFPLWLAPVQVTVLPIGEAHQAFAADVAQRLRAKGIRVKLDQDNESLGKRIRNTKLEKIPYTLVIGDQEVASKTATLESRGDGKIGALPIEDILARFDTEIASRS
jgi:threonyl-tRNA synthetase